MLKKLEKRGKIVLAMFVALFLRGRKISPDEFSLLRIERLLVIRQHNQMGDMLLAVPAFRGLRRRFPNSHIALIAASINTDVMLNNPYVDEVMTYAKERNRRNILRIIRFIRDLRRRRFDVVIVLNTVSFSITSMLLAVASGARYLVGSTSLPFGHDLSSRFYHMELPLPSAEELEIMHESEHNLYPLSLIGVHETDLSSLLVPTEADEDGCDRFLAAAFPKGAPFIVIHPGAGKKQNVWPPENHAEIARRLVDRFSVGVVVVRGPVDRESFDLFLEACRVAPPILSCPDIGFLGALMKRSSLTICNDTGIMHIAGAVGSRCIAVFGPTDPRRWKPIGENVVAAHSRNGTVETVTVDEVYATAEKILHDSLGY